MWAPQGKQRHSVQDMLGKSVISEKSLRNSFQTQVSTTQALPTGWSVVPYVSHCLSHKQVYISRPCLYFYPAHHTAISQETTH